jgi:hypothetical protein
VKLSTASGLDGGAKSVAATGLDAGAAALGLARATKVAKRFG